MKAKHKTLKLKKEKKATIDLKDKNIQALMIKKNPEAYIDACVKSKLKSSKKAIITKIWLEKTGFSIEDIQHARNRHPFWKKKKRANSEERRKVRVEKYDFSSGKEKNKTWEENELEKLLELNDIKKDWELAKFFKRSIPSIQFIRRKISLTKRLANAQGKKPDKKFIYKTVLRDEKALRKEVVALEKNKR